MQTTHFTFQCSYDWVGEDCFGLDQAFLRFSSHGQRNISHGLGHSCFYFYQALYRAYVHNTIFVYLLYNFSIGMEGFHTGKLPV